MTNLHDQRERESRYTICPDCGEDLEWHDCGAKPRERALRIRELNNALRSGREYAGVLITKRELMITPGVAARGDEFITRALEVVRMFGDFSEANDPYGEHDFGKFEVDGYGLLWKIDYYDSNLQYGSADPADAALTKRVLTILLAEEY